jgi:hypothetical protein
MIFAAYRDENGNERATTFDCSDCFNRFFFSPCLDPVFVTDFKVSGKTYAERKENARNLAIDVQSFSWPGLYWSECAEIENELETIGKRYGLIREFRENGVI